MTRTIITIPKDTKRWLDQYSQDHHQSTAQTIRTAIREFQQNTQPAWQERLLAQTVGLWRGNRVEGLTYVDRLRVEW